MHAAAAAEPTAVDIVATIVPGSQLQGGGAPSVLPQRIQVRGWARGGPSYSRQRAAPTRAAQCKGCLETESVRVYTVCAPSVRVFVF